MKIYEHIHVKQVYALHQRTLDRYHDFTSTKDLLAEFAISLFDAFSRKDPACNIEISNHHPHFLGQKPEFILNQSFSSDDAKLTIAKAYGFDVWKMIPSSSIDHTFETAVDLLVTGDCLALENLIAKHPEIETARSSFGHRATLLHYAGSNGVEIWRQKVPENLCAIVDMLISRQACYSQLLRQFIYL